MGISIETVGFCPQYNSTWRFQASPQRGGFYVVQIYADERMSPTCTCPSFIYFKGEPWDRTCKHIKAVWEHGCLFNPQWKDPGPNDYARHGIELVSVDAGSWGEPCPGCGGEMTPVRIAV